MSRPRYEPVSQTDADDSISLSSISGSTPSYPYAYSYNTGLPTPSTAPSTISGHSIPASPPPSFHSSQSVSGFPPNYERTTARQLDHNDDDEPPAPGTPRPRTIGSAISRRSSGTFAELWGVAASTTTGAETTHAAERASDALATIANLKKRVEKLEESIGRLLLEKEEPDVTSRADNCCVTFTDASPHLEQAIRGSKDNCCVSFKSTSSSHDKRIQEQRQAIIGVVAIVVLVLCILTFIALAKRGNCNVCTVAN